MARSRVTVISQSGMRMHRGKYTTGPRVINLNGSNVPWRHAPQPARAEREPCSQLRSQVEVEVLYYLSMVNNAWPRESRTYRVADLIGLY